MAYTIDKSKCIGCHSCMAACPMMAITVDADGKCVIDPAKCVSCGTCASICPVSAIAPAN
ncbi:MAG: 4Fe-4S binding protein [Alphaproteobacteria bacterium]|nr:4Fe-4S binding protein [Alphaproteobacteria bacterium]